MKRINGLISLIAVALPMMAQTSTLPGAESLEFQAGGIYYEILDINQKTCQTKSGSSYFSGDKLIVNYGNEVAGEISIPASVENVDGTYPGTYTVVALGQYSFHNITSISVEEGVTSIGPSAMAGSLSLVSVSLPQSIINIGEYAFAGCSLLSNVNIPESVKVIPNSLFASCTSLDKITIPEGVTSIGENAFSRCTVLRSIEIPNSVTQLGQRAFASCISLNSLSIGTGLQSIPSQAFLYDRALPNIVLPANINSIGADAFGGCDMLKEVVCESINPPAISGNSFSQVALSGTLKVYNKALTAYKKSQLWSQFSNIEVIPVTPTGIQLNQNSAVLYLGLSTQLTATLLPENATGEISWSVVSNPENALIVSNSGKVTAQRIGTGTVTASCGELSAQCAINILPSSSESVSIAPLPANIYVGDVLTLSATVRPSTIVAPFTWTSSNPDVVKIVENSGRMTAVAPGNAVISATCEGITGKTAVTILPIEAQSVTLNETSLTLKVGMDALLTASVSPNNTTYPTVTWESSDPNIATVSNGQVIAVGVGECVIRAKCGDVVANCDVVVEITPVEGVALSQNTAEIYINQVLQLSATVLPETATDKSVSWTSSDENVAIVDVTGKVMAIGVGTATITASCSDTSATCQLTVKPILAQEVVLNYGALTLRVNGMQQLTAMVADDVTDKTVNWVSMNPEVATVNDGLVIGVSLGSTIIVAQCGEALAGCAVTVEPTPAESLFLNNTNVALNVGEAFILTPTILPEDATDKSVTWVVEPQDIVAVDNGNVTALAPGNATVTAISGSLAATCTVSVSQPTISISLNFEMETLEVGDILDLIATVNPSNTTDEVVWSSSDLSVADVTSDGIVTAVAIGKAVITAKSGNASAECQINVIGVMADKIELSATQITLNAGQSQKINATVLPSNTADPTVTWISKDEKIASVGPDGTIKAMAAGNTQVIATCGQAQAVCNVTVKEVAPDQVLINYSEITLHVTETFQLQATVASNDNAQFSWTSADSKVASVSASGLVTGVAPGETTVTVSSGNSSSTCKVIVESTSPQYIMLSATDVIMAPGDVMTLTAKVLPEYAEPRALVWSCDNHAVAMVSMNGEVTAIAEGYAVITVTCGEIYAQCAVSVKNNYTPDDDDNPGNGDNSGSDNPGGDNSGDNPGSDNPGSDDNGSGDDNPDNGDGVEEIIADSAVYHIFSLSGIKVMTTTDKSDFNKLSKGIYIINGKKINIR